VRPPSAFHAAVLLSLCIATTACSDGGDAACGPIRREALDPAYTVHVISEAQDVAYTSDPPTSGPHKSGPVLDPVLDEPIPRPIQVGVLEQGQVLLQYLPSLDAADRVALEAFGGKDVTVAPNPDLDDPIVATAWLYKQRCGSFDADAITSFVEERAGKGPEH
jgi:hypothetical protein